MLPVRPEFYQSKSSNLIHTETLARKIALLENSVAVSTPEKVNLLALLLGHKWVSDIAIDREEAWPEAKNLLSQLSIPHKNNFYFHEGAKHEWIQAAATERLLEYILQTRETLSVIEAGVLYGYPVSHCLGYMELIESKWKDDKNIAEFFLSGVFSKQQNVRESEYFNTVWEDIAAHSAKISQEALQFYNNQQEST